MKKTLMMILFIGLAVSMMWGQGLEDFMNLPTDNSSNYLLRSWIGTDGVTWTAEGARTDQTINGKSICWGNSGTRNVISPIYTGGMGTLSFNYVRAFTGSSARSIEVYVNDEKIGETITVDPNSDTVTNYTRGINIVGSIVLEIRSTGSAQVKLDDISWTDFSSGSPSEPSITTLSASNVSATSAVIGGKITSDGGSPIIERGTVWNTSAGVTIDNNKLAEVAPSVGIFSHGRTGLPSNTTIYYRAYAINEIGTSLSDEASFITNKLEPTNHVTGFSASAGTPAHNTITVTWTDATGDQEPDGYLVKASAVSYGDIADPTDGSTEANGTLVKNVAADIQTVDFTGLDANTTYYFKIYPYTNSGTAIDYKTDDTIPQSSLVTGELHYMDILSIGVAYFEDFNGNYSTPDMPIGWYFYETGPNADSHYLTGSGTNSAGNTYLLGIDNEYALGGLLSSSLTPSWGTLIKNNTGQTITRIKVKYTGETWRVGATNRSDRIDFQYSIDATSLSSGSWTDQDDLDYANPGQASTGNGSLQHSHEIEGFIEGLSLANGESIWFRWLDFNATGADDAMGVDDFSVRLFSANTGAATVPAGEPSVVSLPVLPGFTNNDLEINPLAGETADVVVTAETTPTGIEGASQVRLVYTISSSNTALLNATYTINHAGLGYTPGAVGYRWGGNIFQLDAEDFISDEEMTILTIDGLAKGAKGDLELLIGSNSSTLPVELSSFTAMMSAQNYVGLSWITQSETNVRGYHVYRSDSDLLETALLVSPLINAANTSTQQSYYYEDREIHQDGTYYYWLENVDFDGSAAFHGPISITVSLSGNNDAPGIPLKTELGAIYPNPFNPSAWVSFGIARPADVVINIYNARGQLVRSLLNENRGIGYHRIKWDGKDDLGSNCGTGIYYIRMQSDADSFVRKALLMK